MGQTSNVYALVKADGRYFAHVVEAIARLVAGEHIDFAAVVLDLADVEPFDRSVYIAARAIAPGQVATYGDLAARIGAGATARR